ncbi:hypothetical protein [Candidatus Mycoplasma haematominutum]|uniref:Uncharacterized protein n=1 Tax=Candidatus Mycoplasma haematominutum 'Birmingham 1' TaxID=1116213 RepID=G8C3T9_9MOLU|nr:hypothetical protein [Candidatus Mycoplasma haematominutum]CCE66987.1 hypothetical protein MHM_04690 [Candidatus Mycoplasma haematominutum 'Birmingham 1']
MQFIQNMTKDHYSQSIQFIEGLKKTVFKQQEISELLKDFHLKLPRLISFFMNAENRTQFQAMFLGESLLKTKETFKILSGQATGVNNIFRVQEGLLTHIMNKFLTAPEETMKKVDRLSKLIGSISNKHRQGASSAGATTQNQSVAEPYLLSRERIDRFFQSRSDSSQDVYEDILLVEIGLNQLGVPIPSRGTSIVNSIIAGALDSFLKAQN